MKLQKIFFALLIFILSAHICFGQKSQKDLLFSEFGSTACEDYASRLDSWFVSVTNEPDAVGYAVISGDSKLFFEKLYFREWIFGHLLLRFYEKPEKKRFFVVEGNSSSELKIELWRLTPNSSKIADFNKNWNYSLVLNEEKVLYESVENGGVCPHVNQVSVFVEILKANPQLNGKVIFYESKKKNFLKQKRDFLKAINEININRLIISRKTDYDGYLEFRLIPQN